MKRFFIVMCCAITVCASCSRRTEPVAEDGFAWEVDRFADLRVLRYQVPGFDSLTLQQKKLIYYLSEAALCGRDILYDQNSKDGLAVRKMLEGIYAGYPGDRTTEEFRRFEVYLKRVWFSNGIYHHYSSDKFVPGFSQTSFADYVQATPAEFFPEQLGSAADIIKRFTPILFDPTVAPKRVSQEDGTDLVLGSACNYYEGVTQAEVEAFYAKMTDTLATEPPSYGLNSKVVKENGRVVEKLWKVGGMYSEWISQIVQWLEKAAEVAENAHQAEVIRALITYYKTGNLKEFDRYNILWVRDTSRVDFVNGFIEVYGDPLGRKGAWESVVNFRDEEATARTEILSRNAQWFEDHSPVDSLFKKKEVKGVSAKAITVAMLGGDCYPASPIGINLPNADWIRKEYGSKSVTLQNITNAGNLASLGNGFLEEFAWSDDEISRARRYGALADVLHTDLHECLGHASGQLLDTVAGDELKNYASTLEEARADLFALYYLMDDKLEELGLVPDRNVTRAAYDAYIRNGLFTQLVRIEYGRTVEEAHMRCRKMIAEWCFEHGQEHRVIERRVRSGKTYFVVRDYNRLRALFGELLAEVQRIKSEGDYAAGRELVETYAVQIDPELHKEALERYKALNLAPFTGFINPHYTPVIENNEIVDIKIEYPDDFAAQMMKYSQNYSK